MAILNAAVGYSQILFKIIPNPTILPKNESGIIIAPGIHKSQETGNFDTTDQIIGFGQIIATGPDCKYVKPEDYIFFDRRSVRPVPLGHEVWNLSEQNLIAFVPKNDPSMVKAFEEYKEATEAFEKEGAEVFKQRRTTDMLAGNGIIGLQ